MANEEGRTGRSAAWGVAAVVFGAGAFTTWPVAVAPKSTFPIWPTYVFGGIAAVALYMCFATIWGWWPSARSAAVTSTDRHRASGGRSGGGCCACRGDELQQVRPRPIGGG